LLTILRFWGEVLVSVEYGELWRRMARHLTSDGENRSVFYYPHHSEKNILLLKTRFYDQFTPNADKRRYGGLRPFVITRKGRDQSLCRWHAGAAPGRTQRRRTPRGRGARRHCCQTGLRRRDGRQAIGRSVGAIGAGSTSRPVR
jgi:hypothetical protein